MATRQANEKNAPQVKVNERGLGSPEQAKRRQDNKADGEPLAAETAEESAVVTKTISLDDIVLAEDIQNLLPEPSQEELDKLERQLLREGECRDPLVVRKGCNTLLDGYNRYQLIKKHNLRFKVKEVELEEGQTVEGWIEANQLGRRNLKKQAICYYIGKSYHNAPKHQGKRSEEGTQRQGKAQELAKQMGADEKTVRRWSKIFCNVETLAQNCGPDIRRKYLSEQVVLTEQQLQRLADLLPSEQREAIPRIIEAGKMVKEKAAKLTPAEKGEKFVGGWKKLKKEEQVEMVRSLLEDESFANSVMEILDQQDPPTDEEDDTDAELDDAAEE